jgi:hypothetical protein
MAVTIKWMFILNKQSILIVIFFALFLEIIVKNK